MRVMFIGALFGVLAISLGCSDAETDETKSGESPELSQVAVKKAITLPEVFNSIELGTDGSQVSAIRPVFGYTDVVACPGLLEVTCGFTRSPFDGRVS